MLTNKQIFFAIPCGDYYSNQKNIIQKICELYNIRPIINESDNTTDSLLSQIFEQIMLCDYFVADISSNSPNVIFELGYAFKAKHISKIGLLLSNVSKCPSDLQAIKRLQYSSYRIFADKLNDWISSILNVDSKIIDDSFIRFVGYYDSFQDIDHFISKWQIPLGCDYSLTFNGFTFSNANLPIISRHLAYLDNYTFEFDCLINNKVIGWIVKGTQLNFIDRVIDFCIMFNLSSDGFIHPHIFSKNKLEPGSLYKPFKREKIPDGIDCNGKRLNIKTRVEDIIITVLINDVECLRMDCSTESYKAYYDSVSEKTNQVGFRCDYTEQATIYNVKVYQ